MMILTTDALMTSSCSDVILCVCVTVLYKYMYYNSPYFTEYQRS